MRRLLKGERYVLPISRIIYDIVLTACIATGVEGIFRLSGSEKRIKELKLAFDSPDRYGKGLVWEGYTVHDAANVLRRYLNDLPEPVVPLALYEKFREPLRGATKQAVGDAEGPQFVEHFDEKVAIERYQKLITELPPLNRQLLLYLLDLLAVFAAKADENRMNSQNLAAIFQPGMLSHPDHDMSPEEYRLNQCVIIFLIENQDHFLIGMQGTGTDEKTKQEIESGAVTGAAPVTPVSNRQSGLGRSSSNASAGAQSVWRDGQIRRNRSVNSRHSKSGNETPIPHSPALSATPTNGGLGRSNTVPSKRSPAIAGGKFKRPEHMANSHSPTLLEPLTQAHPETPRLSEQSNLAPPMGATPSTSSVAGRSQEKLLSVPQDHLTTPQKDRSLQGIFQRSPTDDNKRPPNKLKKKRIPGSMNHSAQSSSTSLAHHGNVVSPNADVTANPIDEATPLETEHFHVPAQQQQQQPTSDPSSVPTPRGPQFPAPDNHLRPEGDGLRGNKSPPASVHSGYNDGSDLEHGPESHTTGSGEPSEKEKKRRWKLGRRKDENNPIAGSPAGPDGVNRSQEHADTSTASFGSGAQKPRKSFTGEHAEPSQSISSDQKRSHEHEREGKDNRDETKGPIGWIRTKMREVKETAEQRRAKSPPANHGHGFTSRGKSLDIRREASEQGAPKPVEKPAEKTTEKPTEKPAEKPVETPAQQPAEQPVKEPLTDVPEVGQEKLATKPAREASDKACE